MPRGGKRPGAGRKPGLRIEPRAQSPIRIAELTLSDHLPELVEVALAIALEDRDKQMLVYCIDRVLGRAVARTENGQPGDFDLDLSDFDSDELRAAFKLVKSA